MKNHQSTIRWLSMIAALACAPAVDAETVTITIQNRAPSNGLYMTPFWVGFHDGSFDLFDPGVPLVPGGGVERIAEDGAAATLTAEFASSAAGMAGGIDGVITAPGGFPGAPVFDPHELDSATFALDPVANRYFSFASMVIPSNDAFVGNHNPVMFELFDDDGKFNGPITITVRGSK